MPIYEYRCSNCSHELEVLQKLSDPVLTACPDCHQEALVKLVSAAGFQLKGSGWYATDFRNSGKPAAKSEAKDAAKGGSAAAESKPATDSKPDAAATSPTSAAASTGCGGGCSCH